MWIYTYNDVYMRIVCGHEYSLVLSIEYSLVLSIMYMSIPNYTHVHITSSAAYFFDYECIYIRI